MSSRLESPPPDAADWPPPPSSAPETFTVEGMTVTKHRDQLTIYNSQLKRTWIFVSIFQLTVYVIVWAFSINTWIGFHNRYGTPGMLWSDPFFLRQARGITIQYLMMALLFTLPSWVTFVVYQGGGKTVFSRLTKTVQAGKRITPIRSVTVGRQPSVSRQRVFVSVVSDRPANSFLSNRVAQFNFRQPENAARFAVELRDFLDVPVQWPTGMS